MRSALACLLLILAGCSDPVADAKKQYQIVKKSGDPDEICRAARKVSEAHLKAGDEKGYRDADLYADIDCQTAKLR